MQTYGNIQLCTNALVLYEYVGATYDCMRVINMSCAYIRARASATYARVPHTCACATYKRFLYAHHTLTSKPGRWSYMIWRCASNKRRLRQLHKSKQVFKKDEAAWTRSSLCATYPASALNGRGSCISTWILRRLSTASTEKVYGVILRAYGIPQHILLVIKSFYNNFKCKWETANPASVWRPVLDNDVFCRRCSSTWRLPGWCGKQHRTDHRTSNGPSSQPLKIWI